MTPGEFDDLLAQDESEEIQDAVETQASRLSEPPGIVREGDTAVLTADRLADYQTIKGAFDARDLDPAEWVVERVKTNDWTVTAFGKTREHPVQANNHQLTLFLRRASSYMRPARVDGQIFVPGKLRPPSLEKPLLIALISDHQIPYHERKLHTLTCEWIRHNQPDEIAIMGDVIDFPTISKYDADPINDTPVNTGIQQTYEVLRDYVVAYPGCRRRILWGNHDDPRGDGRLGKIIRQKVPALWGLQQANGGPSAFSLSWLCRTDELGYEEISHPLGGYPHAFMTFEPAKIRGYHGWITRPQAGSSALATTADLSESAAIGHTHKQSVSYRTYGPSGHERVVTAVELGTMSDIQRLTYAVVKNMQTGYATLTIWPDGEFLAENAIYRNGSLFWRDQRYS